MRNQPNLSPADWGVRFKECAQQGPAVGSAARSLCTHSGLAWGREKDPVGRSPGWGRLQERKRARKSATHLWLGSEQRDSGSGVLAVPFPAPRASSGAERTGDCKMLHFVLNSFSLELTG